MGVPGDRVVVISNEDDFWCLCDLPTLAPDSGRWSGSVITNGVVFTKSKFQSISFILVEGVRVQDTNVHDPFLKIVRPDELQPRRKVSLELGSCQYLRYSPSYCRGRIVP